MLWIDQPPPTGFSVGKPYVKDVKNIAKELEDFYDVFEEVKPKKLWLAG